VVALTDALMLTYRQSASVVQHAAAKKGIVLKLSASQLSKQGCFIAPLLACLAGTLL
jgi:hypothetical protein